MKKSKKPMNQGAKECRKYFYEQYQEVKQRPYNASFQKDGMLFNHICGRFPVSWVKGLIDFYLKWDDTFVKNCGYTIGVFYCKINQMLELSIHKSHWTQKHEQRKGLKSVQGMGDLKYLAEKAKEIK